MNITDQLAQALEGAERLLEGKHIAWHFAGGVNDCANGYGEGIPCPKCDRAAITAALSAYRASKEGEVEYRMLEEGETIQEGDELRNGFGDWVPFRPVAFGKPVSIPRRSRRPIRAT